MTGKNRVILITGASGFLGQRILRQLVEGGIGTIRCLVRPGSEWKYSSDSYVACHMHSGIEYFPASFNDIETLKRALEGVDIVYHVAASKTGSFAAQVANTVVGTENLLKAVTESHVSRFVLVSSFSVLGVADLPRGALVDESVPLEAHPELRDPYAYAKQRQEQLVWEYARDHGVPAVVVRPGVIYGPGQPVLTIRVGVEMFGWFLFLGGDNSVPLTHCDNCAEAIIMAGTVEGVVGEAFNICDDDLPSAREILKLYRRRVGGVRKLSIPLWLLKLIARVNVWYSERSKGNLPVVFSPYVINILWRRMRFSNRKAKEKLGWQPRIGVAEGLESVIAAQMKN